MNTFVDAARSFRTQFDLNFSEKIIVDFFAGGGGASTAKLSWDTIGKWKNST